METATPANILVSRAFMPWQKIIELVKGKLAPNAFIVFLTLEEAPKILPEGYTLFAEQSYLLPGILSEKSHHFWVFKSGLGFPENMAS